MLLVKRRPAPFYGLGAAKPWGREVAAQVAALEGREAGFAINEERPLMIRMGERYYPVPGVDVGQMEASLYVLGKLHDIFGKET